MRLHDPPHGRQACPECSSFDQGVGQIFLRLRLFSYRSLPKRGQSCYIPAPPPQSLNGSKVLYYILSATEELLQGYLQRTLCITKLPRSSNDVATFHMFCHDVMKTSQNSGTESPVNTADNSGIPHFSALRSGPGTAAVWERKQYPSKGRFSW